MTVAPGLFLKFNPYFDRCFTLKSVSQSLILMYIKNKDMDIT